MKFAEPIWLFAGVAVIAALLWLYRRFDFRQRAALAEFASSHLLAKLTASFSPGRRRLKRTFFVAAIALVFTALARPQLGYHWEEQKSRGIDILFAIDTSKSMLTQDVTPDRLTRAKMAVTDLVRKLDGDRVGLIAFAGDAFLQAPLTIDYDAFQETLDAVNVGIVPRGGTDISSAIQEAQAAFGKESANRKILVLITDGEDLETKGIDAARAAAKDGLTIYTVGVGSPAGGLIPVPNDNGGTDFLKDASGQYVKSHLDENTLKQIAQATGGLYEPLGQQSQGLDTLYREALAPLPKQDLASRSQKVYDERFQWPLALGLALLLASTLIGTRRMQRTQVRRPQKAIGSAFLAGLLGAVIFSSSAQASSQSAEKAYQKGDFPDAEKQYEQAAGQRPQAPLEFNIGASAYKNDDYDKALPAFQKALNTDQVGVQQGAYYDLGNTEYRLGQKTEKSAKDETIKAWQEAVKSYDAALKLKPDDADAKFNRDFVQKKLEQLQKKQNQQQKQDQQNQQNKQDQQDKQQQSGSQQKQDQSNQDKQNQQGQSGQQQQNQSQGKQANQNQSSGSQNSQQNEAQNGKSGQQNQANANSPQKQNGQQGQPKNDQSGQQQTAGNQNEKNQGQGAQQPQDQQNGNGNQNGQLAQNNEKQAGPRGETIPDKNAGKQQEVAANEAENGAPGEMTRQEARDLLNSLKNGEHVLPVTADARNSGNHPPDEQPFKDW